MFVTSPPHCLQSGQMEARSDHRVSLERNRGGRANALGSTWSSEVLSENVVPDRIG